MGLFKHGLVAAGALCLAGAPVSAIEVLTVVNASAQPWVLNDEFHGGAPMELTDADGTRTVFKGKAIHIPAGRSVSMMFSPWGPVMPAKYLQQEQQLGVPARSFLFDVKDAKGTVCGSVVHLVSSATGKAATLIDQAWADTWSKADQLVLKKDADHTVLTIQTDFAQFKPNQAKADCIPSAGVGH